MGVPTSEVGYTSAMPRKEDHEVHKDMWWHWGEEKKISNMEYKEKFQISLDRIALLSVKFFWPVNVFYVKGFLRLR